MADPSRTNIATTVMLNVKKRRRRQSSPPRQASGKDATTTSVNRTILPSLFLLLLLSSSGRSPNYCCCDAFQFRRIQPNHHKLHPSKRLSVETATRTNDASFHNRRRKRTRKNILSLQSSQNIDDRSESANKSNDTNTDASDAHKNNPSKDGLHEEEPTALKSSTEPVENKDDGTEPSSSSPTPSLAEAEALRAKAAELRAEIKAMELEVKQRATQKQQEKDAVTDELIATLFVPLSYQDPNESSRTSSVKEASSSDDDKTLPVNNDDSTTASASATIPDARVVADRLRQGKFSRPQILAVVDRLFQQHHRHEGGGGRDEAAATANSFATETDETSSSPSETEERGAKNDPASTPTAGGEIVSNGNPGPYRDYFRVLVQAAMLLDDSIVANTTFGDASTTSKTANANTDNTPTITAAAKTTESSSAKPPSFSSSSSSFPSPIAFVASGNIRKAIQSRIKELQQRRDAERNQRMRQYMVESRAAAASSTSTSSSTSWSHSPSSGAPYHPNGTVATSVASGETPAFIPLWIPSSYIPYIVSLDRANTQESSSEVAAPANATRATASATEDSTRTSTPASSSSPRSNNFPFAIVRNSTLEATELKILKEKVLLGSRFYTTSYEYAPGAALFKGVMRTSLGSTPQTVPYEAASNNQTTTNRVWWRLLFDSSNSLSTLGNSNNTAEVFADIQKRLEENGLGDKVQLFVLPDPEAPQTETAAAARRPPTTQERRPHLQPAVMEDPAILALPKRLTPDESQLSRGWIRTLGKGLTYPIAILSTLFYSVKAFALNPNFFDALIYQRDLTVLYSCLPLAVGFLSVQLIHEVAHYLVARRNKIKIGAPVPVSTLFWSHLPFFGCITPLRSFPPNRKALVDFALSGPMAALTASLGMVLGGVLLTSQASARQIAKFPVLSVNAMKSNFLLGSILSWLLPKTMMLPLAQPIPMHPLFVIGRFGMISSALNLLPIFRLDGGRACFAVMGQRQGAVISAFTILWVASNFFMSSSMFLLWTLLVVVFQMRMEIPCRDECTGVGGTREWLWFLSFALSASILIPFPHKH